MLEQAVHDAALGRLGCEPKGFLRLMTADVRIKMFAKAFRRCGLAKQGGQNVTE